MKQVCKINGCGMYCVGLGLCSKHYTRFKRYGDVDTAKCIHGQDRKRNVLYSTYMNIKKRCYNENSSSYKYYGGCGIHLSSERLGSSGFETFCKDMGQKPGKEYSIDRIDSNGNYCKKIVDELQLRFKPIIGETQYYINEKQQLKLKIDCDY